jgi:hypothetical protein
LNSKLPIIANNRKPTIIPKQLLLSSILVFTQYICLSVLRHNQKCFSSTKLQQKRTRCSNLPKLLKLFNISSSYIFDENIILEIRIVLLLQYEE